MMAAAMDPAAPSGPAAPDIDAADIEAGRLLFARRCDFVTGVVSPGNLPEPRLPEVAFAGRSNVGKSSLVNALTGRTTLARTSNTPGRTREINFFSLDGVLMLVDLPGYGYARAAKTDRRKWNRLAEAYVKGRPNLRRLCLLVDSRHGAKPSDEATMALLDEAAVSYQIVLTKVDKISVQARADLTETLAAHLAKHPAAHPEILATSARNGDGIPELRAVLARMAVPNKLG
ncbi:MAG: ribosome biogenesis GTP-binding protein YihA/YsxC [Alphaproteobacteria bacterium]|nr:ribosome biogenesis GTP-binding protein YihA/YsxC [Alphaproteobacteria bacterium]